MFFKKRKYQERWNLSFGMWGLQFLNSKTAKRSPSNFIVNACFPACLGASTCISPREHGCIVASTYATVSLRLTSPKQYHSRAKRVQGFYHWFYSSVEFTWETTRVNFQFYFFSTYILVKLQGDSVNYGSGWHLAILLITLWPLKVWRFPTLAFE